MFTYDPTTDLGKVRLLINDTDMASPLFQDEDITAVLDLEDEEIKLAAANLLDVIASNVALVMRRIKIMDLENDGPAVAKALREQAKTLREQVEEGCFEIVTMLDTTFSEREQRYKNALREG